MSEAKEKIVILFLSLLKFQKKSWFRFVTLPLHFNRAGRRVFENPDDVLKYFFSNDVQDKLAQPRFETI